MTAQEAIDVLFNEWKCIDRNDGIHCDRKCETCDLVMDVGIIREAYNMAITALQAQDSPKPIAESVQNVQNEDLISRKAAIDTEGLEEEIRCEMCKNPMHTNKGCDGNCKYDEKLYERIIQILDKRIKPLPSAQPETAKRIVGKSRDGMTLWYQCDMCNEPVDAQDDFCRGCGRRLIDG